MTVSGTVSVEVGLVGSRGTMESEKRGVCVCVCVFYLFRLPVNVGDYDSVMSFVFSSSRQIHFLHNCIVYPFVLYIMVKIT